MLKRQARYVVLSHYSIYTPEMHLHEREERKMSVQHRRTDRLDGFIPETLRRDCLMLLTRLTPLHCYKQGKQ